MNILLTLIIGFIIGTAVSVNALYVLIRFYEYVRFKHEQEEKEAEERERKKDFKKNYIFDLDDDNK